MELLESLSPLLLTSELVLVSLFDSVCYLYLMFVSPDAVVLVLSDICAVDCQ